MPIVFNKVNQSYVLAIWESTEDLDFLLKKAILSNDEFAQFRNFKSESRKREYLTVRALLRAVFPNDDYLISYSANGKPNLPGKKNISISHTKNFVGLIAGEFNHGGIDLETINERIFKLATKFMNEEEVKKAGDNPSADLLQIIWGAKEVLYKIHEIGDVDFKKHLNVGEISEGHSGKLTAEIRKAGYQKKYEVHYEKVEPMMVTWAVD